MKRFASRVLGSGRVTWLCEVLKLKLLLKVPPSARLKIENFGASSGWYEKSANLC
jgi:hypothetical protein